MSLVLPMLSEGGWTAVGLLITLVLSPFVLLGVQWLRQRLGLSEETKQAVQKATHTDKPPADVDAALGALARRLERYERRDTAWEIHTTKVEDWGTYAYDQLPEDRRRPIPARPRILRQDDDE